MIQLVLISQTWTTHLESKGLQAEHEIDDLREDREFLVLMTTSGVEIDCLRTGQSLWVLEGQCFRRTSLPRNERLSSFSSKVSIEVFCCRSLFQSPEVLAVGLYSHASAPQCSQAPAARVSALLKAKCFHLRRREKAASGPLVALEEVVRRAWSKEDGHYGCALGIDDGSGLLLSRSCCYNTHYHLDCGISVSKGQWMVEGSGRGLTGSNSLAGKRPNHDVKACSGINPISFDLASAPDTLERPVKEVQTISIRKWVDVKPTGENGNKARRKSKKTPRTRLH